MPGLQLSYPLSRAAQAAPTFFAAPRTFAEPQLFNKRTGRCYARAARVNLSITIADCAEYLMPLTAGSPEAEAMLAEKRAREEFIEAKTRRASAEELEKKRDAWMRASQNRKDLAVDKS